MKKLIAYCGLDCEKCDAYIATQNDDQALRKKTAELWTQLNGMELLQINSASNLLNLLHRKARDFSDFTYR